MASDGGTSKRDELFGRRCVCGGWIDYRKAASVAKHRRCGSDGDDKKRRKPERPARDR